MLAYTFHSGTLPNASIQAIAVAVCTVANKLGTRRLGRQIDCLMLVVPPGMFVLLTTLLLIALGKLTLNVGL